MSDNKIRDDILNLLYPKNNEKRFIYMRIKSRKHILKFIELENLKYYNKKNIYILITERFLIFNNETGTPSINLSNIKHTSSIVIDLDYSRDIE